MAPSAGFAPTRYVLIGGFLGAGKTTAVLALARRLQREGVRVALIANDQSTGLVDTARMRAEGFQVEEITGGCFCCRFDDLIDASIQAGEQVPPEVIIAEPVGSCTDLQATVTYPLRQYFGEAFTLAPFSVLVDPHRCASYLGLWGRNRFSDDVGYVYGKQLEEAEIIIVHKSDLLSSGQVERLSAELGARYPSAEVLCASSLTGEGLDQWHGRLQHGGLGTKATMEIDYDVYARGEALLGWVNVRGSLDGDADFDANRLLQQFCRDLSTDLAASGAAIAHLKATLADADGRLAGVSVTDDEGRANVTAELDRPVRGGDLIINLRAEQDPIDLRDRVIDLLDMLPQRFSVGDEDAFRPARPVPTHRLAKA